MSESTALLSRRRMLGFSVVSAAALALAWYARLEDPCPGLAVLGPHERQMLDAMGDAMFPKDNPMGLGWLELNLSADVDGLLNGGLNAAMATPFRALLRGVDMAALWSFGARFADCTLAERLELLQAWGADGPYPRRLAHDSLKSVMGFAYFNHPQVLARLGYQPACRDIAKGIYAF